MNPGVMTPNRQTTLLIPAVFVTMRFYNSTCVLAATHQLGGDVRGVDEDRSPALHAISEAVEDLVAWGVLKVSTGNMR